MNRHLPLAFVVFALATPLVQAQQSASLFPQGYLGHVALTDAIKKAAAAHPERVRVD